MMIRELILLALILFVLSVITIGLITLVNYMTRLSDKSLAISILNLRLENSGWLIRYCQRNNDSRGERSLIEERYNLLKEKRFYENRM